MKKSLLMFLFFWFCFWVGTHFRRRQRKKQKIAINLFFVMSLIYLMGLNLIQQYGVAVNDIIVNGIVGSAILKMLYI